MEVILLERIRKLGDLGDKVKVSPGYGRNYLVPYQKALPANKANLAKFEERRAELEQAAKAKIDAANVRLAKIEGLVIDIVARAADEGKLYGSIGVAEIAKAITDAAGIEVCKSEIHMPEGPIRQIGEYAFVVELFTNIETQVKVQVAAEQSA